MIFVLKLREITDRTGFRVRNFKPTPVKLSQCIQNAAPTDKNLPPPMIYHRNFNDKQIEKGLEFRVY